MKIDVIGKKKNLVCHFYYRAGCRFGISVGAGHEFGH